MSDVADVDPPSYPLDARPDDADAWADPNGPGEEDAHMPDAAEILSEQIVTEAGDVPEGEEPEAEFS
jgi:hypothetical protein